VNWLGYAGLVLTGVAVLVVLGGAAFVLPRVLRVRRVSVETTRVVELYRQAINLSMLEQDELSAERAQLMGRFRSVRRVVTHPLVIALLDSYRLRRRRARGAVAQ
jgi:hypothetical protein